MIGEGTQIALDMYRCLETVIQDPIQIETILKECMERFSVVTAGNLEEFIIAFIGR